MPAPCREWSLEAALESEAEVVREGFPRMIELVHGPKVESPAPSVHPIMPFSFLVTKRGCDGDH